MESLQGTGCRRKTHPVQPSLSKDFFTAPVIDAMEGRDVLSANIPIAFIQTPMPDAEVGEQVIMKITVVPVDLLVEIAPETYGPYVKLFKAMYGQLIASLLWYKKFRGNLIWKASDMNSTHMIPVLLT